MSHEPHFCRDAKIYEPPPDLRRPNNDNESSILRCCCAKYTRHGELATVFSPTLIIESRDAKIFQKYMSHLQIWGDRIMTWCKFHTEVLLYKVQSPRRPGDRVFSIPNCNTFSRCSFHNKNDFVTRLAFKNNGDKYNNSSYVIFQALNRNVGRNLSYIVEQPARLLSELSMCLEVGPNGGIFV